MIHHDDLGEYWCDMCGACGWATVTVTDHVCDPHRAGLFWARRLRYRKLAAAMNEAREIEKAYKWI